MRCIFFLILLLVGSTNKLDANIRVTIVLDKNSTSNVKSAAEELGRLVQKIEPNYSVEIRNRKNKEGINIIITPKHKDTQGLITDSDGYLIKRLDESSVLISGITDIGTELGIYEYLEDVIGVAWLMPSELWTYLPDKIISFFPENIIYSTPFFGTRLLSPLDIDKKSSKMGEWARKNKLRGRVEFHHNMNELFKNSTNLNFIASYKGQWKLPDFSTSHNWQPNFDADGIVEYSSNQIIKYFKRNSEKSSYSLGINDSYRFDTRIMGLTKNRLGLVNFSESYYSWANKVVQNVNRSFPNKTFGVLAYLNVAEPPTFKIESQIVPFVPYERTQWLVDSLRIADVKLLMDWQSVSSSVGVYDYVYGMNYLIPRTNLKAISFSIKEIAGMGITHYYAEFYPNWIDGPKGWLIASLLWNPQQDPVELIDIWYNKAFGTKAAVPMKEFYNLWEDFWASKMIHTSWWKSGEIWLNFSDISYLKEIPEDPYLQSKKYLDQAVRLAENNESLDRIMFLYEMFEFQRLNYYYFNKLRDPTTGEFISSKILEANLQKLRRYEINDVFYRFYKKYITYNLL